jgi:hypothetical protein
MFLSLDMDIGAWIGRCLRPEDGTARAAAL